MSLIKLDISYLRKHNTIRNESDTIKDGECKVVRIKTGVIRGESVIVCNRDNSIEAYPLDYSKLLK